MSPHLRRRSQTVHTKNAPTTVPPSPRENTSVVWGIPVTQKWSPRERAGQERAGLQLRFHDLRHTCITKLAESQQANRPSWLYQAT